MVRSSNGLEDSLKVRAKSRAVVEIAKTVPGFSASWVAIEYVSSAFSRAIRARVKKYGATSLNLVGNLFGLTVCLIVLTSMLLIAVWMQEATGRKAGYG